MHAEIEVPIGKTTYAADGSKIVPFERNVRLKKGGNTARHEAKHTIAALETGTTVKKVTIIPGPGYLGLTELSSFNAVAALAPDADGMDGTSHDVFIATRSGVDLSAARSVAGRINRDKEEHIEAVASALEENLTLTGEDITEVIKDVEKGKVIDIVVFRPTGVVETFEKRSTSNRVPIPLYRGNTEKKAA